MPRLDEILVARGLAPSPDVARALVLAGRVFHGTRRCDKAGAAMATDAVLTLRRPAHPWASRGGVKLAAALEHFGVSARGRVCLDIGAGEGGFTDVLVAGGARLIYAVDTGYGAMAWRLRCNERVRLLERTNARYLDRTLLPLAPTLLVCDASFIRLKTVVAAALSLAADGAHLVALLKPQFEARRHELAAGGVVACAATRHRIRHEAMGWLAAEAGWQLRGCMASPLRGARAGNEEFFLHGVKGGDDKSDAKSEDDASRP